MIQLIWLIPVFPLLGFLLISFFKKALPGNLTGVLASVIVLSSFIISVNLFLNIDAPVTIDYFNWIHAGTLSIPFSFLIDHASIVMLLIVTGVGFLIHVYSIGYMSHDENKARFFAHLNLFIFFMLLLVMGSNYVIMFAGWEGVGLCSYLLIGFWFKNDEYNRAANKAFIMNRIGDLGFLLGIILIYITFGSTNFKEVFSGAKAFTDNQPVIIAITMLLFIGAIGKSAQIPLYTWLPDAMAGPTPVSALIHAATMVTAGIYMVVRSNILYSLAPTTLAFITIIGTATAVFAATIAVAQTDIKKVLAYSTVSQLGYMFAALGVGAYSTGLFHVTTHAFFKALLFLAAGSVIHAMSGEQDIRKMGGLRKKLPITFIVFLIGTLAISGLPPFAGFFSKDEILAHVYEQNKFVFVVLAITSLLTAFYMFRVLFLTFFGTFRGSPPTPRGRAQHPIIEPTNVEEKLSPSFGGVGEASLHESPAVMTVPLIILALLSTFGGFLGMPAVFSNIHLFDKYLAIPAGIITGETPASFEWMMMIAFTIALIILYVITRSFFAKPQNVPALNENDFTPATRVLFNKYYIDELYDNIIVKPLYRLSDVFYKIIDNRLVDGVVNATGKGVVWGGRTLRLVQSGNIGFYIFIMVVGIIAMFIFNIYIK